MGALRRLTFPVALLCVGCLSSSYRIPRGELERLSQIPPEARWQSVRATQQMAAGDSPPRNTVTAPVPLVLVNSPDTFMVSGRLWWTPRPYGTWGRGWRSASLNPGRGVAAAARSSSGSSSSSGSGGSSSGSGRGGAAAAAAVAVAAVVAAVTAGVFILAASEGIRYDGWLALHPEETVYLEMFDGSTVAIPLSSLRPEHLAGASGATVYEGGSDRYVRLQRAPLNRVGMSLSSALGGGWGPDGGVNTASPGFFGGVFIGAFPVQWLGVGATFDATGGPGRLSAMTGGELRLLPVAYGGVYAGAGASFGQAENPTREWMGWYLRGGLLAELPFTTRLTGQLRVGAARHDTRSELGVVWTPEVLLGVGIY